MRTPSFCCLVLCAVLLAGCSASRPTDYYMLTGAGRPASVAPLPRRAIALDSLIVAGYLDRPGIVILSETGTSVTVPRFNVWAEPLQQGIRRVLLDTLEGPLLERNITVLAHQEESRHLCCALQLEIDRLDADRAGRVHLQARWTLLGRPGHVAERGRFAADEQIEMPPFGTPEMFSAVVAAESRLLERLAAKLIEVLPAAMEKADLDS